jgi:hypothetical protein
VERNPHGQAHSLAQSSISHRTVWICFRGLAVRRFFFMKASVSATTRAGFGEPRAPTRFLESGLRGRPGLRESATARRATSKRRPRARGALDGCSTGCGATLWQDLPQNASERGARVNLRQRGRPLTSARRAWRLAPRWAWRDAPDPRSDAEAGEATGMGRGRIMGSRNRWAVRGSSVCVIEDVRVDASDLTR